jgi:hypothetical protein
MTPDQPALPLCPVCKKPVSLETAKADALGRAIHSECYLQLLHKKEAKEFSPRPS